MVFWIGVQEKSHHMQALLCQQLLKKSMVLVMLSPCCGSSEACPTTVPNLLRWLHASIWLLPVHSQEMMDILLTSEGLSSRSDTCMWMTFTDCGVTFKVLLWRFLCNLIDMLVKIFLHFPGGIADVCYAVCRSWSLCIGGSQHNCNSTCWKRFGLKSCFW